MIWSRRRFRVLLRRALHTADSPSRTAAAFSLGVFLGCSPFLGLHTVLALGLAFLLRLNRLAVLLGSFILNPWTFLPIYGAGTTLGFLLLGRSPADLPPLMFAEAEPLRPATLLAFFDRLGPFLAPFLIGNTALGVVGAAGTYPVCLFLVKRFRAARAARRARRTAARRAAPPASPVAPPVDDRRSEASGGSAPGAPRL